MENRERVMIEFLKDLKMAVEKIDREISKEEEESCARFRCEKTCPMYQYAEEKKTKFQEIKSEILKRAKEKKACKDEYKRAYKSETIQELCTVIKGNFFWCCGNNVLTAEFIELYKDEFEKNEIYCNKGRIGGFTLLTGNSQRSFYGSAIVFAKDNSYVMAYGDTRVFACDNSTVELYNYSKVDNKKGVIIFDKR